MFDDLFSKHFGLSEIFLTVFLYHVLSSAIVHTMCGFAAAMSFHSDVGKVSVVSVVLFPVLALIHVMTYGAMTSYLIAQVFVSSEQVMQHWIAVVFGVGQTFLQLFLGVARLD